jgi:hypothetical protein
MVAEAKNAKAFGFDCSRARSVRALLLVGKVLPAVQLDDELGCVAQEVGDIVFDRHLAPEAGTYQAMISQLRPEDSLSIG